MIKDLSKTLAKYDKAHRNLKIAIVRSNYHLDLTKSLEHSCKEYLIAAGVKEKNIKVFKVPGSWEIPLITKKIASTKKFNAIATFGIIIRGETYHFEILANECARALMDISLEFNIPITYEILATYNLKQAEKRSKGKYNKGRETAISLLETIESHSKLEMI